MTDSVKITSRDLRQGMSIGGWDMEYTAENEATGCKVIWQTHGSHPESQRRMRERALVALKLMTEVYKI